MPATSVAIAPQSDAQTLDAAWRPELRLAGAWSAESMGFSEAMRFIEQLVQLPVSSWLAIGRTLIDVRVALLARQVARMEVDDAMVKHDLAVHAWQLRDAMETAACYASRRIQRWDPKASSEFAAARSAAESMAFALLTRTLINTATLHLLCEPFSSSRLLRI